MYHPKLSPDPVKRDEQLQTLRLALPALPLLSPDLPAETLGNYLQTYTLALSAAIELALPQRSRSRRHFYDGWTPISMAFRAQLTALIEIHRFCLGQHGRTAWSSLTALQTGLASIIHTWCTRHNRFTLPVDQNTNIAFWIGLVLPNDFYQARARLLFHLLSAIPETLASLHGRKRLERRKGHSTYTQRIEQAREQKKLGILIQHLLGSKQQSPDFTSFLSCENTLLTDPLAIHESCTRSAHSHFSPSTNRNILDTSVIDWSTKDSVLASKDQFINNVTSTIPTQLLPTFQPRIEELWLGLSFPFQTDLSDRMDSRLTQIHCPTQEEFMTLLRRKHSNSPGPSSITYELLRALPDEHIQFIYDLLSSLWPHRDVYVPEHWKWRWLCPIPKAGLETTSWANLRPLMLLDSIRKVG
jgi:hypothetical protein